MPIAAPIVLNGVASGFVETSPDQLAQFQIPHPSKNVPERDWYVHLPTKRGNHARTQAI
jgi:hypothetical protein